MLNSTTVQQEHARLWHFQLGHPSCAKLAEISKRNPYATVTIHGKPAPKLCKSCILSKQHVAAYPTVGGTRATHLLELVHSDICGPLSIPSLGGARYFLLFIDDYSRYSWIYTLKHKSEAFESFKEFQALAKRQSGYQLKCLRTDNGGEFDSHAFNGFCKQRGIIRQYSVAYSPSQNGVAERRNRTLQEMTRAMLKHSRLPLSYWGEAITTANYLHNRLPGKSTSMVTPYERWFNKPPQIQHLRVFGSPAYAHITKSKLVHTKLSDRSEKLIFVGYAEGMKAYRSIHPSTHVRINSRSVIFAELTVPHSLDQGGNNVLLPSVSDPDTDILLPQDNDPEIDTDTSEISHDDDDVQSNDGVASPHSPNVELGIEPERLSNGSDEVSPAQSPPPSPKPHELPPHIVVSEHELTRPLQDTTQVSGLKIQVTRIGKQVKCTWNMNLLNQWGIQRLSRRLRCNLSQSAYYQT